MGRKKKTKETRTLKEQIEEYLFAGIVEFEELSGLRVEKIDVRHHRSIGFDAKETMDVTIIVDNT